MTDALTAGELPLPRRPDYLRHETTLTSWLTTTDHKRIAILYAVTITIFFFMGGAAITLVRLELLTPNGGLLSSDAYNKLFSFHGIVMVWFFLVPSIPNTLGNFLLPLMIGAPDVAFRRLNLFSWYLTIAAGAFTVYALVAGGVDTGWTFYTPYSTMFSNSHVLAAAAGVFVVGFASIATGSISSPPPICCARRSLVPAAAFRVGHLRDVDHHGAGNSRAGDFAPARDGRAMARPADLRSRPWR
jgi:cytochrome c oxidase subunit 1